jgi:hypothetical protein
MNISSIKQIVFQSKIFGIWSLFVLFHLVYHQIVDTKMNTAAIYSECQNDECHCGARVNAMYVGKWIFQRQISSLVKSI